MREAAILECLMKYRLLLFLLLSLPLSLAVADGAVAADVKAGKKIYDQSCKYCHKSDYDEKFGPGLAGIMDRRDAEWVEKFLINPAEMIKSDEYAQTLKEGNEYGLTMPALPEMKDAAKRADVIEYMRTLE